MLELRIIIKEDEFEDLRFKLEHFDIIIIIQNYDGTSDFKLTIFNYLFIHEFKIIASIKSCIKMRPFIVSFEK